MMILICFEKQACAGGWTIQNQCAGRQTQLIIKGHLQCGLYVGLSQRDYVARKRLDNSMGND